MSVVRVRRGRVPQVLLQQARVDEVRRFSVEELRPFAERNLRPEVLQEFREAAKIR